MFSMAPSYPEHIDTELKRIRETLELRWNPKAKAIPGTGRYDARGDLIKPKYEPRFELWDKDKDGQEYLFLTVQQKDGSFRIPDSWLIDFVNMVNPANYGGNIGKMLATLVDDKNKQLTDIQESEFEDFAESVTRWYLDYGKPKVNVPQPVH